MYSQFSPNMLKTFEQCPRKFDFRYVQNIQMPVNNDIFGFGKNIHALASYYLRGENIDKMEKSLSENEADIWNYLKSSEYFSYDVINTEYNLTVRLDKYFFGGRLDALVKNGNKYYILDYKTGTIPKNLKYDFQTMIYILAVKEFFQTDRIWFVYMDLKSRNNIIVQYTEDMEQEYQTKLIDTAKKIISNDFTKKYENCSCEYSMICF